MVGLQFSTKRAVRVPSPLLAWAVWVGGEVVRVVGTLLAWSGWLAGPWVRRFKHKRTSRSQAFLGWSEIGRMMKDFPLETLVGEILRGHAALMVWTPETRIHFGRTKIPDALQETGGTSMEEKRKILEMVARGKISPEEGVKLLEALDNTESRPVGSTKKGRSLLIEVHDLEDDEHVVVRLPLSLIQWALKAGVSFKALATRNVQDPEVRAQVERAFEALNELDFDHLVQEAREMGELIRVDSEEARVNIRIE